MAPWRTLITAVHPHPSVKINHGATFLVTDQQGAIPLGSAGEYGLYSADTRFISRHELRLNGKRPDSVASVRLSFRHARWHMITDSIAGTGGAMREARVAVTVDRLVSLHRMHEDLTLHTYARAPLTVLLEIALESDFADLFEVRYRSWQRRADLNTWWLGPNILESRYQNKDFVRRCLVRAITQIGGITYANGALRIPADLVPGEQWRLCLQYDLLTSDDQIPTLAVRSPFDSGEEDPMKQARSWQLSVSHVEPADIRLQFAYERAIEDFAALRLHEQETSFDRWMPAAGLPWVMALFGRDAHDGVLDETGAFPELPIGTSEMQAYVYGAKTRIAALFEAWGDASRAALLRREAAELRRKFIATFWLEGAEELAFLLDGRKRPVGTVVSDSGHCLWMGILDEERGRAAGRRLMQPDMFTGWGLRTLSDHHPSYDPHSYQRGSVWPHDSVIAAAGLRRYGMNEEAWTILDGLLAAVMCFEDSQMPELFAGLPKGEFAVPVPYRMANVPQAWAAGSVLHMVRILLGLEPDIPAGRIYLDPALPAWCSKLELRRMRLGPHEVRVSVQRKGDGRHMVDADAPGLEVVRGVPPWLEIGAD